MTRPDLRAVSTEPTPAAEPVPAAAAPAEAPAPADKPATDETQVKKRRAAFRVIDGGG